jgi:hypothetical protein
VGVDVTPETLQLAALIATALWLVRSRWSLIGHAWANARSWERAVLVLALLPIPDPLDELAGLLVARRVAERARR